MNGFTALGMVVGMFAVVILIGVGATALTGNPIVGMIVAGACYFSIPLLERKLS